MSAFELVSELRGLPAPKPRPDHLRLVNDSESATTATARPVRLSEIIGQPKLVQRLDSHVRAAVARNETPGHILLDGPAGMGKTSIALATRNELAACAKRSCSFFEIIGSSLPNIKALARLMAKLSPGAVLFVDEVHTLPRGVQVALYRVLEGGLMMVEGVPEPIVVPEFTLIGATTHPGRLLPAFRRRFALTGHLADYDRDDIALQLMEHCERAGIEISTEGAQVIATASRFTPAKAVELLNNIRDFAFTVTDDPNAPLDQDTCSMGLEFCETNPDGLDERDMRVLETLAVNFLGGPVGIHPLATALAMDESELRSDVEPHLVRGGYVRHLPRGRAATKKTYETLGLVVPALVCGLL